jgi:DNA-binding PadR family transcriptional regulator
MSLQHALLTSLLEKPSTGYDLAHRFDRSIGYFWRATHQQIYRDLGRMAETGWVKAEEADEPGGRRKKVYHVLPAGREELVRWASESAPDQDKQRELLVKLRAEAVLGAVDLREEFKRLMTEHQARLELYRVIEARDFAPDTDPVARRLQHAVLRYGILTQEVWLQWAGDVLAMLEDEKRRATPV